jgi:hypothetical protein
MLPSALDWHGRKMQLTLLDCARMNVFLLCDMSGRQLLTERGVLLPFLSAGSCRSLATNTLRFAAWHETHNTAVCSTC